jgi:hypothetical protein
MDEVEEKEQAEEKHEVEKKEMAEEKKVVTPELKLDVIPDAILDAIPDVILHDIPDVAPKEEESADDRWEIVKRKWKKRTLSSEPTSPDDATKPDQAETVLHAMEAITDRLGGIIFSSKNAFDALTKPSDRPIWPAAKPKKQRNKVQDGNITPAGMVSSRLSTTEVGKRLQGATLGTPGPVLKRRSTISPQPGKSIKITNEAIILPSNPLPAAALPTPEVKSHNIHGFAETSRRQVFYHRCTWNQPGVWASPAGYERSTPVTARLAG